MNVLFLTSSFPRRKGDFAGLFVSELADNLYWRGNSIEVVAPADVDRSRCDVFSPYQVHRFNYIWPYRLQNLAYGDGIPENISRNPFKILEIPLFLLAFLIMCLRHGRDKDILHAHWILPSGLIGIIAKTFLGSKLIITIHSADIYLLKNLPCASLITRFFIKNSDKVTVVSFHQKEILRELVENDEELLKKVDIVPMGVHVTPYPDIADREKIRKKLSLSEKQVLLYIGRLVPIKGIRLLIKASSQIENTVALIAGEGSQRGVLQAEARKFNQSVRFTGCLSGEEKYAILDIADVVIFPSIVLKKGRTEGLPVSLLEAMSRGKAIIASDVGGIGSVIKNGENGLLVKPGDLKSLEMAIRTLLDDRCLRVRLGMAALKSVEKFSWCKIGEHFHDIYRYVVAPRDDSIKTCCSSLV